MLQREAAFFFDFVSCVFLPVHPCSHGRDLAGWHARCETKQTKGRLLSNRLPEARRSKVAAELGLLHVASFQRNSVGVDSASGSSGGWPIIARTVYEYLLRAVSWIAVIDRVSPRLDLEISIPCRLLKRYSLRATRRDCSIYFRPHKSIDDRFPRSSYVANTFRTCRFVYTLV